MEGDNILDTIEQTDADVPIKEHAKHTKETFIYSGSRALERASYYGVRSLLTLYMINNLGMSRETAMPVYGWIITSLIFSQIIGALIGDLLLGNKKTLLLGGLLQAIGAFAFCIPSTTGLYLGLGLMILGGGLYTPNILSQFGKIYLNKEKIIDGGFTIFYTAINLGSFIGVFIIGLIGFSNYVYGFITGGAFMLLSLLLLFFTKEKEPVTISETKSTNNGIGIIIISLVLIGTFWAIYDFANNGLIHLDMQFSQTLNLHNLFSTYRSSPVLVVGIIFSIIWSFFYLNHLLKAIIGFILAGISLGILLLIPENISQTHVFILILSFILFSIAEFFITPTLYSILTKNSNPKYLEIIMSLSFIPIKIFMYLSGFCSNYVNEQPLISITISTVLFVLLGIGLTIVLMVYNKGKSI